MNRVPVLIVVLLFLAAGCSKDQGGSKPTLKIESITPQVPLQGTLDAIVSYTWNKGDMGQGTFVVIRQRLNQHPLPPGTPNTDTLTGPIPSFPDQSNAEFEWKIDWATIHESDAENDTFTFKFAAITRSGVKSDTIVSPQVVVFYQ